MGADNPKTGAREGVPRSPAGALMSYDQAALRAAGFTPASPAHHVTARITSAYDAASTCPTWLAMLESTFADRSEDERAAVIGLLQEWLGMALVEEKSKALSRALIFHGPSNTGKTDLIKTMSGLLTDNPIATPIGALDGTHGLMEFQRKAPWVLHEAFNGAKWHFSDIVKSILSGDPVQINIKNGPVVTKRIRQPIFWGTNYPPQFKEATRAIINRMVVVSTAVVFDPKTPTGVAITARQAGFSEPSDFILANEKPGLLNWAAAGAGARLVRDHS
jgi:phage/plasmid-associated DNA primase